MRRVLAGLIALLAAVGPTPVAALDPADCPSRLVDVPIETVAIPDGYSWASLTPPLRGDWWAATITRDAGTAQFNPTMYVTVACGTDPVHLLSRLGAIEDAMDVSDKIAVIEIGDATVARREHDEPGGLAASVEIYFARGPFLVEVSSWEINQGDMEAVAQAIDAVLVATP